MPGPRVTPVHGDETLPSRVDVVVIGGGIIGSSTALELSDMGLRVALCEKGGIGREQSSRNWGWVRISRRDEREIPLMASSLKLWPALRERTGRDLGYRKSGIMFACKTEQMMDRFERWSAHLEPYQLDTRIVTKDEFDTLMPGNREAVVGGMFTAADGVAEPQLAAPAIAEAARDRGAAVLTECAVRGVETAAGRISGVVTERGRIACDAAVLAGGAWSRLFSGNLGLDLPSLKLLNSVARTSPIPGAPDPAYCNSGPSFRRRADGGYNIATSALNIADVVPDSFRQFFRYLPALKAELGSVRLRFGGRLFHEIGEPRRWALDQETPFEYTRVLDPRPDRRSLERTLAYFGRAFPAFADAKIQQSWGGYMDITPDAVPVISGVDALPGFFLSTGYSGHGFGIGPGAGRLTAELVAGKTPSVDPSAFRFSRFSDGSVVRPHQGF